MALSVHWSGKGPAIIFLHGWGLHSGIWSAGDNNLPQRLARQYQVATVDLPGHGHSVLGDNGFTLTSATNALAECIAEQAIVIGWSLGGLLALNLALEYPDLVRRLVLISSTPRFCQSRDWRPALRTATLQAFATALQENQHDTVQRFLALQVQGSADQRYQLRLLRQAIAACPPARPAALHSGLMVLEQTDLRSRMDAIKQPCLLLYGEHDRIVPPAAGAAVERLLPNAIQHVIAGAGHAPFLSDPETSLHLIEDFLDD